MRPKHSLNHNIKSVPLVLTGNTPASAADLIADRHQRRLDVTMRQRFRKYMMQEDSNPTLLIGATIEDYRALFARTDNKVGLQTIERGLLTADSDENYYN
jgi:hypothetical protein